MIDFNDEELISCSKSFVYVYTIKYVQLDCFYISQRPLQLIYDRFTDIFYKNLMKGTR